METKKFVLPSKLSLNKETIAALNEEQMTTIAGGGVVECSTDGSHCSCTNDSCLAESPVAE
jgi:natural product precursor